MLNVSDGMARLLYHNNIDHQCHLYHPYHFLSSPFNNIQIISIKHIFCPYWYHPYHHFIQILVDTSQRSSDTCMQSVTVTGWQDLTNLVSQMRRSSITSVLQPYETIQQAHCYLAQFSENQFILKVVVLLKS